MVVAIIVGIASAMGRFVGVILRPPIGRSAGVACSGRPRFVGVAFVHGAGEGLLRLRTALRLRRRNLVPLFALLGLALGGRGRRTRLRTRLRRVEQGFDLVVLGEFEGRFAPFILHSEMFYRPVRELIAADGSAEHLQMKNSNGHTALDEAVESGHEDIIALLAEAAN